MSFLIDIKEELDEQVQEQLRKFRRGSAATDYRGWYRVQQAMARARDLTIYHDNIQNYIMPNLFDENGDAVAWYHWRDPQQVQVNMVKRNLKESSKPNRQRGRVTPTRLRMLMKEILQARIYEYLNPTQDMEKLKIMCIMVRDQADGHILLLVSLILCPGNLTDSVPDGLHGVDVEHGVHVLHHHSQAL